jgi:hypothetical protein
MGFYAYEYTGGQFASLAGFKNRADISLFQGRGLFFCSARGRRESDQDSEQNRQAATVHRIPPLPLLHARK